MQSIVSYPGWHAAHGPSRKTRKANTNPVVPLPPNSVTSVAGSEQPIRAVRAHKTEQRALPLEKETHVLHAERGRNRTNILATSCDLGVSQAPDFTAIHP